MPASIKDETFYSIRAVNYPSTAISELLARNFELGNCPVWTLSHNQLSFAFAYCLIFSFLDLLLHSLS